MKTASKIRHRVNRYLANDLYRPGESDNELRLREVLGRLRRTEQIELYSLLREHSVNYVGFGLMLEKALKTNLNLDS